MTCSQCHIRNFGMHDYGDPANIDPTAGRAEDAEQGDRDAQLPDRPERALGGVHARVPAPPGVPRRSSTSTEFLSADAAKGLDLPAREVARDGATTRDGEEEAPHAGQGEAAGRRAEGQGRAGPRRRLGGLHRRRHGAALGDRRAPRACCSRSPRRSRRSSASATATGSCGRWRIAALPFFWMTFGYHLWRRICPLAVMGQLGRLVGPAGHAQDGRLDGQELPARPARR